MIWTKDNLHQDLTLGLEWDDQKTDPIGIPPLPVDIDLAEIAPPEGQHCYFCGAPYQAVGRTDEGHAICVLCVKYGVPGR